MSYLQSKAELMITCICFQVLYSWSGLLMAGAQSKSVSFSVSVVFCHLQQHHQAFVSAQVPPPDGSIMKLHYEKGRLSIKMTDVSGERAFMELIFTKASCFSCFIYTRATTHSVSHGLLNFSFNWRPITKTYSGLHLIL